MLLLVIIVLLDIFFFCFHNEHEPTEDGVYNETIEKPPKAKELLFTGRTLSLGKIIGTGSIYTLISSNAEGSSGGCLIDDNVNVFAISCASFFDDPNVGLEEETCLPKNLLPYKDIDIPENGDPKACSSRNRNLALSLFHPAVTFLLERL